METYWTWERIITRLEEAGSFYFSANTRRFFHSRRGSVHQGPGGVYFTESVKGPDGLGGECRYYKVVRFNPEKGRCDSIGDPLTSYPSMKAANRAAAKMASGS